MDTHSYNNVVVNVLWTGGWDSTFRVLQLVQETNAAIQPIYVIDTERLSTLIEIRTMDRLKKMIVSRFPSAEARIRPHRFFSIHDIAEDPLVTESYLRLRQRWHLGSQFDWLPRLAKQNGLEGLELSIEGDSRPRMGVSACLRDHVILHDDEHVGKYWVFDTSKEAPDRLNVFSFFRFPLLQATKTEMHDRVRQSNCSDILMQTWFCFAPVRGKPCGVCNPCQLVVEEGLSQRLSRGALLKFRCLRLRRLLRRAAKRILPSFGLADS